MTGAGKTQIFKGVHMTVNIGTGLITPEQRELLKKAESTLQTEYLLNGLKKTIKYQKDGTEVQVLQ